MSYTNLDDVVKELEYLVKRKVVIGVLGDGGNCGEDELTVLEYANYLEYGTSKMQAFGFFRKAITSYAKDFDTKKEQLVNELLQGQLTGRQALMQMGEFVRGRIILTIATARSWARPLTPKYLKWKAKHYPNRVNQPLIREGFLIKSIRYKIVKGNTIEYISDWGNI